MTHGYVTDKNALVKRLHRIEGQVRGIERMVEDERYCIDILTQIGAVSTALDSVAVKLLEDHVSHCVTGALASGDAAVAEEKGRELLEAVVGTALRPSEAADVGTDHPVLGGEGRNHLPPCPPVLRPSVKQNDRVSPARGRVMQASAVDGDESVLDGLELGQRQTPRWG